MSRFRACIDLHAGRVKQIVGGTLTDGDASSLRTNFVSDQSAAHFAALYREHGVRGSHVIMLGPGNDAAAREALAAWPGGLQVGGGVNAENARWWVDLGAEKVILTSFLFPGGTYSPDRLRDILKELGGDKERLVIDLSCRRKGNSWFVAMNKWQTITDFEVNQANIKMLEGHCSEFLIHAADVEGLQAGIDEDLVAKLAQWCSIPITYAGGSKDVSDLELVNRISGGKVDLTIGSALDIFGGDRVKFMDCVEWNRTLTPDV